MEKRKKEIEEQLKSIHNLAVTFYLMMGYRHQEDHGKLYESQHPAELMVWGMACYAYRDIDGLDGEELLEELNDMQSVDGLF